jgi:DNA-binding transcriptional MerR regulator
MNNTEEITLEDAAFEQELSQPVLQESISLPAALCDDLLLQEINSIPNKMGFKIGEVADMLGIKQYILRYWESEFNLLKPKKAKNNQRFYTRRDVENAYLIRKLLHRDRFSIEGARNALKELSTHVKKEKNWQSVVGRFEVFHDRADELVSDIRRLKELFT